MDANLNTAVTRGTVGGQDDEVAANSLVTEDVPAGATVAGGPATEMSSEGIE